jgi:hypothetical protein
VSIGSPNPKKTLSQDVRVMGGLTVDDAATASGPVSTQGLAGALKIKDSAGSDKFSAAYNGVSAVVFQVAGINVASYLTATGNVELFQVCTVDSLITDIDAGVTFGDGSPNSGVALVVGSEARSTVNMDFTAVGWQLVTDGAPSLRVQILKQVFGSYDDSTWVDVSGTSTSTGGMPRIGVGGGVKATASDIHLWPVTTFSRGDIIRAVVTNNSGVNGWYSLQVYGYRNVKKT